MISKVARLRAKKGFTLIEAVVVIAIIGILVAMIIPSLTYDQKPALGKALAKDVYYTAQDVLSTIEITNPKAIESGVVCFYAQLDNYGHVVPGQSGICNPVVGGATADGARYAAIAYSTFDTLLTMGGKTDEQKKMYSKMQTALDKYVTDKEGMEGYIYIVTDKTYRVLGSYWLNVDAAGIDITLRDNCIMGSGNYCCSYPLEMCNAGAIFYTTAETHATT